MIHVLLMTMMLVLTAMPRVASAQPLSGGAPHIAIQLVAESTQPAPGQTVTLALVAKPEAGWHGYWVNPGDAGLGMTLDWVLPSGVTAGPLRYPVPETLILSGLMNHVYEGPYALLVDVRVPPGARVGDRLPLRAKGQWLACTDKICVPERGDFAIDLVVGDGAVAAGQRAAFDEYRARLPRPLGAAAHFAIDNGRLRVGIPYPAGAALDAPHLFPVTEGALRYAEPQGFSRVGDMLVLETATGTEKVGEIDAVLRIGAHRGVIVRALPGVVPAGGEAVGAAEGGAVAAILWALGGAVLGGLLLNIMPCVFPILSLKALSLAKAGGGEREARRDAVAYLIGAVVMCTALGGVLLALRAGGMAAGWAFQLQDPRVILFLLLLVTGIALNLAGLFELGGINAGSGLAARQGVAGSFWTGALAAFIATPCTGPFMGAALGAALVLPTAAALVVFAGLGLGLALPFVAVAFVPALRARLPRPGAWMETARRILSVPMFATALALAWLLGRQTGANGMSVGLAAALVAGLLLWWLGLRQRRGRGGAAMVALLLVVALVGGTFALPAQNVGAANTKVAGQPFDANKLAALREGGKPVFLYFTADWCLTCKANEAAAIDRAEVAEAFRTGGVQVMVGDWTNGDATISRFLEAHGRSGVPLYLWYAPGQEARVLPQVLTPAMLAGLVR